MKKILSFCLCTCLTCGIYLTNVLAEEQNSLDSTVVEENKMDNNDTFWEEFLISNQYESYSASKEFIPTDYVIYDINNDESPELMLEATSDAPFYYTWMFTREESEVTLAYEGYGYGEFRYSPTYQSILLPSETKPFSGTGVTPFYQLEGKNFEEKFCIIQDMGVNYYTDESGEREISDDERNQYFADTVWFEWNKIPVGQDRVSSKEDLSAYLGSDFDTLVNRIGNMHDIGSTDGREYSNGAVVVCCSFDDTRISFLSINASCEYSIMGIEYGMPEADAVKIAYEDAEKVTEDSPQLKYFKMKNGNKLSFHIDDSGLIDGIDIWAESES